MGWGGGGCYGRGLTNTLLVVHSTRVLFQQYASSFCFWGLFFCFFRGCGRSLWIRVAGGLPADEIQGGWWASGASAEGSSFLHLVGRIRSRAGSQQYHLYVNIPPYTTVLYKGADARRRLRACPSWLKAYEYETQGC